MGERQFADCLKVGFDADLMFGGLPACPCG